MWQVRQFILFRDLAEPDLWLGTDGHGRWGEINGAHRPELDGSFDVAMSCTPFTHTLPIRRVPLPIGEATELTVLEIDVETLGVVPVGHVYERTGRASLESVDERLDDRVRRRRVRCRHRSRRPIPQGFLSVEPTQPAARWSSTCLMPADISGSRRAKAIAASRKPTGLPVS